jgi:hypothetical protein
MQRERRGDHVARRNLRLLEIADHGGQLGAEAPPGHVEHGGVTIDPYDPRVAEPLQATVGQRAGAGAQVDDQRGGTVQRVERQRRVLQDVVVIGNEAQDLPVVFVGLDSQVLGDAHGAHCSGWRLRRRRSSPRTAGARR